MERKQDCCLWCQASLNLKAASDGRGESINRLHKHALSIFRTVLRYLLTQRVWVHFISLIFPYSSAFSSQCNFKLCQLKVFKVNAFKKCFLFKTQNCVRGEKGRHYMVLLKRLSSRYNENNTSNKLHQPLNNCNRNNCWDSLVFYVVYYNSRLYCKCIIINSVLK